MNQYSTIIQYKNIYRQLEPRAEALNLRPNLLRLASMGATEEGRLKIAIAILRRLPDQNSSQCWEWKGGRHSAGYGDIRDSPITRFAHRLSYCLFVKSPPDNLEVCHKCDNPPCINPAHLFLGTRSENHQDCRTKGRWDDFLVSGELSPRAVITAKHVLIGKKLRAEGMMFKEIAKTMRVPYWAMYRAVKGDRWKSLCD